MSLSLSGSASQLIPPDEFEFWSIKIDWSTSVIHHMMLDFNLAMQAVVGIIDSYISCYASDVLEPETYAALKTDHYITDGGKKPVFMAGHSQEPRVESGLGDAVQTFLDKQKPRSVILVSFGTLMDGGHGADVLFAYLAELKIPYVFAGGGQSSNLPQTTQVLVDTAELEGHAVAPEWLNQVGVLNHPVRRPRGRVASSHRSPRSPSFASSRTVASTPWSRLHWPRCPSW